MIVISALVAVLLAIRSLVRREPIYSRFREQLGRSILIELEFLVAGDICETVAMTPTFMNVAILAIIVLVRNFPIFT